jgi:hypothetical protein
MGRQPRTPWVIPEGTPPSKCRGCAAEIYFVAYVRKVDNRPGRMPLNPDGVPHFATCSHAEEFRKERVSR